MGTEARAEEQMDCEKTQGRAGGGATKVFVILRGRRLHGHTHLSKLIELYILNRHNLLLINHVKKFTF